MLVQSCPVLSSLVQSCKVFNRHGTCSAGIIEHIKLHPGFHQVVCTLGHKSSSGVSPGEGAGASWRGLERELARGLNEKPLLVLAALLTTMDPCWPVSGSCGWL